jgi:hypothetical protein
VHNDRPQRRYPGLLASLRGQEQPTFRLIQAAAGFSLIASALTTGVDERYLIATVIKIPQYISIVGLRITWYGADLRRLSHSHIYPQQMLLRPRFSHAAWIGGGLYPC